MKLAQLKEAEEGGLYRSCPSRIQVLREEIQRLQSREECMWKQRAQNDWLKEGDKNPQFFHCRANQRNRRNLILGLEDEDGNWLEREADFGGGGVLEKYFKNIFNSTNLYIFRPFKCKQNLVIWLSD